MDLNPTTGVPYSGKYVVQGTEIDVLIGFGHGEDIRIYDAEAPKHHYPDEMIFFHRPYRVKNGKLYYGKKGEDDIIIFNKIKEYEVPKK